MLYGFNACLKDTNVVVCTAATTQEEFDKFLDKTQDAIEFEIWDALDNQDMKGVAMPWRLLAPDQAEECGVEIVSKLYAAKYQDDMSGTEEEKVETAPETIVASSESAEPNETYDNGRIKISDISINKNTNEITIDVDVNTSSVADMIDDMIAQRKIDNTLTRNELRKEIEEKYDLGISTEAFALYKMSTGKYIAYSVDCDVLIELDGVDISITDATDKRNLDMEDVKQRLQKRSMGIKNDDRLPEEYYFAVKNQAEQDVFVVCAKDEWDNSKCISGSQHSNAMSRLGMYEVKDEFGVFETRQRDKEEEIDRHRSTMLGVGFTENPELIETSEEDYPYELGKPGKRKNSKFTDLSKMLFAVLPPSYAGDDELDVVFGSKTYVVMAPRSVIDEDKQPTKQDNFINAATLEKYNMEATDTNNVYVVKGSVSETQNAARGLGIQETGKLLQLEGIDLFDVPFDWNAQYRVKDGAPKTAHDYRNEAIVILKAAKEKGMDLGAVVSESTQEQKTVDWDKELQRLNQTPEQRINTLFDEFVQRVEVLTKRYDIDPDKLDSDACVTVVSQSPKK